MAPQVPLLATNANANGPLKLPQVSFSKVQDDSSTGPSGTHDLQARSYGYNDFSEFRRPEHYIRHIEPLESDMAVQVEYDMDEQDQEWLDAVNAERKKEQLNPVTYETFEIIVDRLEKEWFDLTKNIPKPDFSLPSQDSPCAICDDPEGENSNAIVFCDGCNLAVHQDCYGVPYIPEGQWLCRKCTVSPEVPVSCILCPCEGGAFKQTVLGEWVHLLCAIWVPETRVANEVFMEPVTGVERISRQRWKLRCSICGIREGACIQCAKSSCFLAFHTTCARKQKFLMPMKSAQGAEPAPLTCYCEKHLPHEQQKVRNAAVESGQLNDDMRMSATLSKTARAYAKTYKPGPPLVPNLIVERIMQYISKVIIRKKSDFVLLVCKYWSLKREARRGAPLLKRLHLEPWTSSTGLKQHSEVEKTIKLEFLQQLRTDLESVRALTLMSRKRESRKLKQTEIVREVLSRFLFSDVAPLRHAFERIMILDRQDYFRHPVSKADVPDYFDIIKRPMCWSVIDGKLERHEYWDNHSFKDDVQLVLDNALLYNKPGSPFYKAAARIQSASKRIMDDLGETSRTPASPTAPTGSDPPIPEAENDSLKGELEPSMGTLKLLASVHLIQDELDLILKDDPVVSLFNYEMPQLKPPPIVPPPPPKRPKTKSIKRSHPKSTRTGLPGQDVLDSTPGSRPPRTRQAARAAASLSDVTTAEAHKGHKSKRPVAALPGQSDVPPMVKDVDNQQSFQMFDAGWILPQDQKRGGRRPVDRSALPPLRKRTKTETSTSQLSRISTSVAENQTLFTNSSDNVSEMVKQDASASLSPERPTLLEDTSSSDIATVLQQLGGTVVIETLDTPLTRRAKALRRKQERAAPVSAVLPSSSSAPATEQHFPPVPSPTAPTALPPRLSTFDHDCDTESELSSLTGAPSEDSPVRVVNAPEPAIPAESVKGARLPKSAADWKPLEGGTLVWAKAESFPWWPAVVFEEDDEDIPPAVLAAKAPRRGYKGPLELVRFYDKKHTWQWVGIDRLEMLGDKDVDQEFLANPSQRQKWKSSSIRQECRAAWRLALEEMETEDVPVELGGALSEQAGNVEPEQGEVNQVNAKSMQSEVNQGNAKPTQSESQKNEVMTVEQQGLVTQVV